MKINVKYSPHCEEILVWGVWGPRTTAMMVERISQDIEQVNNALRGLYEQN